MLECLFAMLLRVDQCIVHAIDVLQSEFWFDVCIFIIPHLRLANMPSSSETQDLWSGVV
jgi:hypothetical protein